MKNGQLVSTENNAHDIVRVNAEMLAATWPWLREKIQIIKKKLERAHAKRDFKHPHSNWLPETIRANIFRGLNGQGTAELYYMVDSWDHESVDGFFLITTETDPFIGVPWMLFVWLAWGRTPRLLEEALPFVEQMARNRGCIKIRHMSPRDGWLRRMRHTGFKVAEFVYEKEVI